MCACICSFALSIIGTGWKAVCRKKCFPEILRVDSLVREEKCVVVKGVVCDAQGEAIVGVNIIEKER